MLERGFVADNLRHARDAEDLLEVQTLALVDDIQNPIGAEVLFALHHRREVGRRIERCAVGLFENARRDFLFVVLALHGHDERAVRFYGEVLFFDFREHRRDVRLRVALAEPRVKRHAEVFIVLFEVGERDFHDLLPQRIAAFFVLLQAAREVVRLRGERFVLFALGAGGGVDLLQLGDGKRRFFGVGAGEVGIEVGKLGVTLLRFGENQTHLQSPVAEVDIADDRIAEEAK